MADNKKSVQFLPSYFQTDKNAKFLSSTIDQFIQTPNLERIDGYVGTTEVSNYNPITDTYISELSPIRARQQLIPGLIFRDETGQITDLVNYEDLVNEIKNQGGNSDNLRNTLKFEHYSYNPRIDWDKLINYDQYHWLPNGPDPITLDVNPFNIAGQTYYYLTPEIILSNGMKVVFTNSYSSGTTVYSSGTEYIVEGVGDFIEFVNFNLLEPNGTLATTFDEVFDNTGFDTYPFDSDKKLALVPDYITINRSSRDLNPWTRYNRWFHADVIKNTAILNGSDFVLNDQRALRPIIEFVSYLPLYNFGLYGIKNVDLIDDLTEFPLEEIPGNVGFHIDGVLLEEGYRIIFNKSNDLYARNKIYKTVFNTSTNQIILVETSDSNVRDSSSVSVNYGKKYSGKSFHYKENLKEWVQSQQHDVHNQAPLFDLCDENGISFSDEDLDNTFEGCRVFGYSVGKGTNDPVLGFPVEKASNAVGIGGYKFKNYIATDTYNSIENGVVVTKSVSNGYYKIPDLIDPRLFKLLNVYNFGFSYYPPVVETFLVTATSTSTIISSAFNLNYVPVGNIDAKVNGELVSVTATFTNSNLTLNFDNEIKQGSQVIIKWNTTSTPVSNHYYDIPLNLLNNPLNDQFQELTLSQLSDHFVSMLEKDNFWKSIQTGPIDTRDTIAYGKKGTVLVQNQDPIVLPMIFLGNKNHNLIDSFRFVASQYAQWKFNFLKLISEYNQQNNPIEIVDQVLLSMSQSKGLESNFYRSDMVPFGSSKVIRKVTVSSTAYNSYPINIEFDLTELSFKSVLVYRNSNQLIYGKDYDFNKVEGSVEFITQLSVNDLLEFHVYNDTLGNFVPPTPTKFGLYQKFIPTIFSDDRYVTNQQMIQCHDGSLIKAFGDYRDAVILELEKRIYNNIKVDYNTIYPGDAIYNLPGAFHSSDHSLELYNKLLEKEFATWTSNYNVDWTENSTYNSSNFKTYNFQSGLNTTTSKVVSGSWRGIYKYFFDTDRPHTHPWEVLGYSVEPSWWNSFYGSAPYTSNNYILWVDLEAGNRRGELSSDYREARYRRPGLTSIIPVDANGNLKNPLDFLLSKVNLDFTSEWKFGEFGPAEVSWRNSSFYPFAVNIVSALLYPNVYCSRFFDTSRIIRNHADRLVYKDDMLFLDPRKLKIDGFENQQTAGYINLIIEHGISKNSTYLNQLATDMKFLTMNLVHRLSGFSSKDKLQIKINAVDPESSSPGLLLPSEDYTLFLNKSNPISTLRISGIVIEKKNNKYLIKGYDRQNPYFTIYKPIHTATSPILKIGGKQESYTIWQPGYDSNNGLTSVEITASSKFYKQGQIVNYNGSYYRVTVSHAAQPTFNNSFFAKMAELPQVGGIRVISSKTFESNQTIINYHSELSSAQEVYDLIIGYGHWLKTQGFVFDDFNTDINEVIDWYYSAKEFAFWDIQNWADGNLITLSPFADYLKIENSESIVDNLFADNYEYSLQKADGQIFPKDGFDITRLDNVCLVRTNNTVEGIFFAKINLVQKEHELILSNSTIFNDTIYDPATGYRQKRIKVNGFRTKGWNGDLSSPGFFYDQIQYSNWQPFKEYYPSQIVVYNSLYYSANRKILNDATFDFTKWTLLDKKPESELLPNFDYKVQQFEDFYSLDIDNFDAGQQQLAQHLIGYSPRPYLSKIITDAKAEYKFYQGFIRDKGTKKSIDNLAKTSINRDTGSIEIKEEWAFRVGAYGAESSFNEIEFPLIEGSYLENPYLVVLKDRLDNNRSGIIHYTTSSDLLIKPKDHVITSTFVTVPGTFEDNNLKLITAGYVRLDDVTSTAYSKNSLLDIANNANITEGDTVWLGFLENGDWSVYRYTNQTAKIKGVFVSAPGLEITFVTDINHSLQVGEIVSITRFNYQVDGVYIVKRIDESDRFTVSSNLAGIVNEPMLSYGSLFKFDSVRFADYQSLSSYTDFFKFAYGSKVWVDRNQDNKWTVLEKINNYSTATEFSTSNSPADQSFAYSLKSIGDTLLVSSPSYHISSSYNYGKVSVYRKFSTEKTQSQFDYYLNSQGNIYCQTNTSTDFGYSLAFDAGKDLYIVGAPSASYVRSTTATNILAPLSTSSNSPRNFLREGLVKVSTRNSNRTAEVIKFVLTRPYSTLGFNSTGTIDTHENSRFGHSVYVNQVSVDSPTTLLVGAPGNDSYKSTGTVFAYRISGTGTSIANFGTDTVSKVVITTPPISTGTISVVFSSPNIVGGTTATGVVIKTGNTGSAVVITNRGSGYNSAPTVTFTGTNMTTVGAAVGYFGFIEIVGTSTISLVPGSKWGHAISGSNSGDTIAISAPGYYSYGVEGTVQLFDQGLYWKQTLDSPFGYNDEFGHSLKVSNSGQFIFVGSTKSLSTFNTYGKVAVYSKQNTGIYSLNQILINPVKNSDQLFGESIEITPDESTLIVSSQGTNRSEYVRFFENKVDLLGETTFDNNETKFVNVVQDSGSVYTYNNYNNYFIQADELVPDNLYIGGRYGKSLAATTGSIFVGAPYQISSDGEYSKFYQFKLNDSSSKTWNVKHQQDELVDVDTFRRVALINTEQDNLLEYLDLYDPVKGRLPGVAEQEIDYKSASDPAIYSLGISSTINDTKNSWIDDHVGQLWWDLSTAKYMWYEQGNETFRKNNWGKLFPGASIDIYEWVKSELLPSEWAVLADSPGGLAKGISGQPKYSDNSVVSVKQILNTLTGAFQNVYYYWVKNKVTLPNSKTRKISAYEVSKLISDPLGYGLKYINILSKNSISLGNIQGDLTGDKISVNISFDRIKNNIPRHTEWLLLNEGDPTSIPNELLTKKLLDSLIGRDSLGNLVPDPALSVREKYGISIRPRQSIFKNRFEALRNCLGFANKILASNRITSGYNFSKLNSFEQIPSELLGQYDFILENFDQLQDVSTEIYERASLSCSVYNGKIIRVDIISAGFGYGYAPTVHIENNENNLAEITTQIDAQGRVVSATIKNSGKNFLTNPVLTVREHVAVIASDTNSNLRWSFYKFDYNLRIWTKFRTQLYNTSLYWRYIDYKGDTFNQYKSFRYILNDVFELDSIDEISQGDYVKILNAGDNNYIILEKAVNGNFSDDYNIVYHQNGTIEFLDSLWNFNTSQYSYDKVTLDETLYDQLPDIELTNILLALKEDLFVDNLKKYWNLFFFASVKYALTEQKMLDWAFKTSFITVKNNVSYLNTSSTFTLDTTEYIENYIQEVKPYRSKIRSFVSAYQYIENGRIHTSDFDLPPYYSDSYGRFTSTSVIVSASTDSSILSAYPWKDWTDNYKYSVKEVLVANGGSGYTSPPLVVFYSNSTPLTQATGEAYIRNGRVYRVVVTNAGSGYDKKVWISFVGGGGSGATASVVLDNTTIRKNTIGLKFDRYSKLSEIGNTTVTFTTSTNGVLYEYELPIHADPDKFTIVATLDKKLILTADYNIVSFSKDENGYNKDHSKFVFVNYLPSAGKLLKVVYKKHISLFNAIDRIQTYYNPTSIMPGNYLPILMEGLEYPGRQISGLKFDYSTTLLGMENTATTVYDNGGGWNDFTSYYARAKVIATATTDTTVLYLNTVSDIVIGQTLNFLNTPLKKVRDDTVVVAINTTNNSIQISSATYLIKFATSTATSVGTPVEYETKIPFNGNLRSGDVISISGIAATGFNGVTVITTVTSNKTFIAPAVGTLQFISTSGSSLSRVRAYSLLETIEPQNRLIGNYNTFIGNCEFGNYNLVSSSPSMMEGYTATWTLSGLNVNFGTGRTYTYFITGTNITSGDFVGGLTGTITTSALSLPITFNIGSTINAVNTSSNGGIYTETYYLNILTTDSSRVIASGSMKLRNSPEGMSVWGIRSYDVDNNISTTFREGDIIRFSITGTNIDFASDGVSLSLVASGSGVSNLDFTNGLLTSSNVVVYSEEEFPVYIDVGLSEDLTTEGLETVTFSLNVSTITNVTTYSTEAIATSTTVTVLDTSLTQPSTYSIEALQSTVYEGSTATFRLKTTYVTIGTQVPFIVTGTISVSDLNTTTYTGTFILVDGGTINPGGQYADVSFNIASDSASTGLESTEFVSMTLTNKVSNSATIYIRDQLDQVYGNTSIIGYAVNGAQSYTRIKIRNTGTFDFDIFDSNQSSSIKPVSGSQIWAVNTSLPSYYVRGIIEPTNVWTGETKFTGPGFANTVTYSDFTSGPVYGNWVTVNTAETSAVFGNLGWFGYAIADSVNQTSASGRFNLTIQVSKTSGGSVVSQGVFDCYVYSDISPSGQGFDGNDFEGEDFRDLL